MPRHKNLNKNIVLTILCLVITVSAFGADAGREILVASGGVGSYPPFDMIIDNQLTGFHIEFVHAVAKRLNIKVTFKTYPWKRAVKMLTDGDLDAVTYMSKTKERERIGYFFEGNVLSKLQDGFFILKSRRNEIASFENLKQLQPYLIGTILGYSYGQAFDGATYLRKDSGAKTEEQLIRKLLHKRFDIAIGGVARIRYFAKQMEVEDKIVFLKPYYSILPQYIVFSRKKKLEKLARQFAQAANSFRTTQQYQDLKTKYGL